MQLINYFKQTKTLPKWMSIKFLPVLPPELRPIIKLQDNTIITSDLNYLYQNLININNRIIQLENLQVSKKFIKNEKIKLQLSLEQLFNNEKTNKQKNKLRIKTKN